MPTGLEMAPLNEKAQLLRRWLDDLPPIDEGAAAQVISANHDSIQARDDEGKDVNRHLEVYQDDSSNDGSSDSGKGPPNKNKKTSSLWLSTPTTLPTQTTSMVGPPVSATNTKIATGPTITSTMRPNPVQSTMRPSSVVESTSIVLSTEVSDFCITIRDVRNRLANRA